MASAVNRVPSSVGMRQKEKSCTKIVRQSRGKILSRAKPESGRAKRDVFWLRCQSSIKCWSRENPSGHLHGQGIPAKHSSLARMTRAIAKC